MLDTIGQAVWDALTTADRTVHLDDYTYDVVQAEIGAWEDNWANAKPLGGPPKPKRTNVFGQPPPPPAISSSLSKPAMQSVNYDFGSTAMTAGFATAPRAAISAAVIPAPPPPPPASMTTVVSRAPAKKRAPAKRKGPAPKTTKKAETKRKAPKRMPQHPETKKFMTVAAYESLTGKKWRPRAKKAAGAKKKAAAPRRVPNKSLAAAAAKREAKGAYAMGTVAAAQKFQKYAQKYPDRAAKDLATKDPRTIYRAKDYRVSNGDFVGQMY